MGKNLPAKVGDARDASSIPGEGKQQPTPVFLPGKIPGTEEPGGLQPMGSQT